MFLAATVANITSISRNSLLLPSTKDRNEKEVAKREGTCFI